MTTQEQAVRHYSDSDWAIQRWDALHEGRIVEPKSFCQLWRTVLLWCTLMQLPLIGDTFVEHEETYEEKVQRENRPPAEPSRVGKAAMPVFRAIGFVLSWTIGLPFRGVWWAFGTVVEFFHDRPAIGRNLRRWLQAAADVTAIVVIGAFAIAGLILIPVALYLAAKYLGGAFSLRELAYGIGGILIWTGVLVALGRTTLLYWYDALTRRIWAGMCVLGSLIAGFFKAIGSIFKLILDIALTNKKHICPPIEIVRSGRYRGY